jgi:hypothetical protein
LLPKALYGTALVAVDEARAFFLEDNQEWCWSREAEVTGMPAATVSEMNQFWSVDLDDPRLVPRLFFDHCVVGVIRVTRERFWVLTSGGSPALWSLSRAGNFRDLALEPVASILAVDTRQIFAVTDGEAPAVWRVALDGSSRKRLVSLDESYDLSLISGSCLELEASKYLAVGLARKFGSPSLRELVVVDTESGALMRRIDAIDSFRNSGEPSRAPLYMEWIDESTLWYEEASFSTDRHEALRNVTPNPGERIIDVPEIWTPFRHAARDGFVVAVAIDLKNDQWKQEFLREPLLYRFRQAKTLAGLPITETDDTVVPDLEEPFLYQDGLTLYFVRAGKEMEVAGTIKLPGEYAANGEMAISLEGEWGAYMCQANNHATWLVDGKNRSKRIVLDGWCYDFTWLPRIEAAPR